MTRVLERQSTACLFGVRFRDAVTGAQIRDGLRVHCWPAEGGRRTPAFRTASHVYAFQGLAGLDDLEAGREPLTFVGSPNLLPRHFVLAVDDPLGRYLPATYPLELPLPYPGRYLDDAPPGSPGDSTPDGLRLFRAPTARTESFFAAVRGELIERDSGAPAGHARVRVRIDGGPPITGLADAAGRFLVLTPLPALVADLAGSPPVVPLPLSQRTFGLSLSVDWAPGAQLPLPGTTVPAYQSLFAQAAAYVWADPAGPPGSVLLAELRPGVALVARTHGRSEVLVSAAPSSP